MISRDCSRAAIIEDQEQARRHANMFRNSGDLVSCHRKLQQIEKFDELLRFFDTYVAKPRAKKEKVNE